MRRIHHVGVVVRDLATAYRFYRDTLGLPLVREARLPGQGVRAALLAAGDTEIELLEPLEASSGVGRFLARRGEGLHHLCLDTPDIHAALGFRSRFWLKELAMNDGPRTMLGVGRGAILIVPSDEVGGTEGMVALSLVAEDFEALIAAFDRAGVKCLRGTGEVTVEPQSSHGVHLHISRYE